MDWKRQNGRNEALATADWRAGDPCYAVTFSQTISCPTLEQSHANPK